MRSVLAVTNSLWDWISNTTLRRPAVLLFWFYLIFKNLFSIQLSPGWVPSWSSTYATCCAWAWAWPVWCVCVTGANGGVAGLPGTALPCSSTGTPSWWSQVWWWCMASVSDFPNLNHRVSFLFLTSVLPSDCKTVLTWHTVRFIETLMSTVTVLL